MDFDLYWKELILFVLFIIGTICNILWSNRRIAAQKAHISFLQEKVKFFSEMTPKKITEYHEAIKYELEEIINDLEKKLEIANYEIANKRKELSIELDKQDSLKAKVDNLQNSIEKLKSESVDTENEAQRLQFLKKNIDYGPVGAWFLLFKKYKDQREEIKNFVSTDNDLNRFLEEKTDKGIDEKSVNRFWKHLESEAWEDFLDMSVGQAGLWAGMDINMQGKEKKER